MREKSRKADAPVIKECKGNCKRMKRWRRSAES